MLHLYIPLNFDKSKLIGPIYFFWVKWAGPGIPDLPHLILSSTRMSEKLKLDLEPNIQGHNVTTHFMKI